MAKRLLMFCTLYLGPKGYVTNRSTTGFEGVTLSPLLGGMITMRPNVIITFVHMTNMYKGNTVVANTPLNYKCLETTCRISAV